MNEKLVRQFERESGLEVYGLGLNRVKWNDRLIKYTKLVEDSTRRACIKKLEDSAQATSNGGDVYLAAAIWLEAEGLETQEEEQLSND